MSLALERIEPDHREWERMDALPDRKVFQTREWVSFVAAAKGAEPIVAAVLDGGAVVVRPNEAIMWYAMKYWRRREVAVCDLGGGADYKRKYGPSEVVRPFFRKSRFRAISNARDLTKRAFRMRQSIRGHLR